MNNINQKFDKTLVVRITSDQYTKLLEAIVQEGKKGIKSRLTNMDKSKIIREMITRYTTHPS
jgi:ribosomal protein S17E